jgi:hypothetical protein
VDSELVLRIFSEDRRKARTGSSDVARRGGIRAWEEDNEPGGEGVWV